jgi:hypothetical protein
MIIQPFSYFGQPIAAAAAGGFIVRTDPSASFVTIAIPGTQFGSTFGQTSFRSDISGYINGGSSLPELPLSGSGQTTNTATNFSTVPYGTSMSRGTSSNLGAIAGTTSNVVFASAAWCVEYWMYIPTGQLTADQAGLFAYSGQLGFMNWTSSGTRMRYLRGPSDSVGDWFPSAGQVVVNTWYHVAMSYVGGGGLTYCCFDGVIRNTISNTGTIGTSDPFGILGWNGNGGQGTAYFQDFRVTKGAGRYAGSIGGTYTIPGSIVTTG